MNQGPYIILRTTERIDLSDPFSASIFHSSTARSSEEVGFQVEVESLNQQDIADLRRDPNVLNIAPPMPTRLIAPNGDSGTHIDDHDDTTWGVLATRAAESPWTGRNVTVAVLDTGIDTGHPAFQGVQLVQQDFTGEGNCDCKGHGTHVAGTIFGQNVNARRYSVAPGVQRALIGKVLNRKGEGSTASLYQAILWAADQGAHIINMSLGIDFPFLVETLEGRGLPTDLATSLALESYRANLRLFDSLAALIRARDGFFQSTLLVAAAGNASKREIHPDYELAVEPPAAADGIVSVGALQTTGAPHDALSIADFSNTGVNISAPGADVYSSVPGGGFEGGWSGTSMASPHVAGVAALWAEKMMTETGRLSVAEISGRLIGRAVKNRLAAGFDPLDVGAGLVQAPLK